MIRETCCPSLGSVKAAVSRGTSRIELCEKLEIGGVTPSRDMIESAIEIAGKTPVNVLIRPRGGDFVYSEAEAAQMLESISLCKEIGVNGVVIGALLPDGNVDKELTLRLADAARPLHVTFHRAIDESKNYMQAIQDVISIGIERILTSGHSGNAYEGRFMLREAVELAAGRTVIMPGCGITDDNLEEIARVTGASEFHGSRI
ncbi:MAG: copper homeostasis protein CutC [Bacteroidales bacterium]|nr:copper homeostasis protein CutC [Bacteroidales bacterium]